MDLSNFEKITKANPINFPKRQDFDMMYMAKTGRFKLSESVFTRLSLEDNSLIQYNKPSGDEAGVYIHIVPGNSGIFLKKHGDKSKGRAFKNEEIITALEGLGVNVKNTIYFTFLEIGMVNDYPMYQIIVDTERYNRLVLGIVAEEDIEGPDISPEFLDDSLNEVLVHQENLEVQMEEQGPQEGNDGSSTSF